MTFIMDRASKQLNILFKISQRAFHKTDISSLIKDIFDILDKEMGMSRGILTLKDLDSDLFVIEASKGLTDKEKRRGRYKPGEGIIGKAVQNRKPLYVMDINRDPGFLNRTGSSPKGKSVAFLCVPVIRHTEVIGTISIDRPTADVETIEKDLSFLKLTADILAEAVFRIREQTEEKQALLEANRVLQKQIGNLYNPDNIVGRCNAMKRVYLQIEQVADSLATVFIRGESGTGKELVAKAIHFSSPRKDNPFIAVNCAALPENLVESELFGHEKGAFTGALQQKKGRFEIADKGTIFLDEIGDISPAVQVRLLRVIQEKNFERVGGTKTLKVDIRIIAATSQDIEKAIQEGRFREDLFYRLDVFPIHLPPLRERKSDIILLADHFLRKYNYMYGKNIKRISTTAIDMMMSYHWPGNVRELENCIERAVLTTSDEVIHGYTLPPSLQTSDLTNTSIIPKEGANLKTIVSSYEKEVIIDALKKFQGKVNRASEYLQTTQRILHYKINSLGIDPKAYK